MKQKRFFSSVAFVLSALMLIASGVLFVHSAAQQNASTSLSVTFNGMNVNYTAEGWYQVKGDASRTALVDNDNDADNKVTFSASEPSSEKTLKVSNTSESNIIILTATENYVLFTYKFTNTSSIGALGMEVSLSLTNVSGSNLKAVKYATSDTLYTNSASGLSALYSSGSFSTFTTPQSGAMDIFEGDPIVAGGNDANASGTGIKYYYILLEIDDLSLPINFTPSFSWTVVCSDAVAPQSYNVTFSRDSTCVIKQGSLCLSYQIRESSQTEPDGGHPSYGVSNPDKWRLFHSNTNYTVQAGKRIFLAMSYQSLKNGYFGTFYVTINNGINPPVTLSYYKTDASWCDPFYYTTIVNSDINYTITFGYVDGEL